MNTAHGGLLRLCLVLSVAVVTVLLLAGCRNDVSETAGSETDVRTLPDEIQTVPSETVTSSADGDETDLPDTAEATVEEATEPETVADVWFRSYPAADLPDYAAYINQNNITALVRNCNGIALAVDADRVSQCGSIETGWVNACVKGEDGEPLVSMKALTALLGADGGDGYATPYGAAAALGKKAVVYDRKLVIFYDTGDGPDVFDDMYTLEALYLCLIDADEQEIVNAFIDLPDTVSNGSNNAVYYTAPDLNLGIQTSVYYCQLGQVKGVETGPRIVAGEGRYLSTDAGLSNHTVVRVYNEQQTMTTQFLAFDTSVLGGVQVACARVGESVLICTAPFFGTDGKDGDVRVFDMFGTLRLDIVLRDVMKGPYTVTTGRFSSAVSDEVLLVTSQRVGEDGKYAYALISLADGKVLSRGALDCSFAVPDGATESAPVSISVRAGGTGKNDSVILFFPEISAVYEGYVETGKFEKADILIPAGAAGVYASSNRGEEYVIAMNESEDTANRSFITVYKRDNSEGKLVDVGFRENVFYAARYIDEDSERYVSQGSFEHIRTDLSNGVMNKLGKTGGNAAKIEDVFENATYGDYAFGGTAGYAERLGSEHLFLEPCFTHRWNRIAGTNALNNYLDSDGNHLYISVGKQGDTSEYVEFSSAYNIGTYADGILDMAKLRLFPLRSFLRGVAPAFRGRNGNPENLVGVSPVHEHEIDVAGDVGDYNVMMIRGFASYLLEQYGTVENINRAFGTPFADASEIDAPRIEGRGDWDNYSGGYFDQWVLYNRYIVSKRIMEAYREALLAGYPPESISAHQIPEAEAVAGFLGDATTRISPIDVVTTCGTAYGGTRYGAFYSGSSFIRFANNAGQWAMSIGEYCCLSDSSQIAYRQLEYIWSHGVRMIHQLPFTDEQAAAEAEAIRQLAELNQPRPGYTGGTTTLVNVSRGNTSYAIVQLGQGNDSDSVGLLKSLKADGTWEGTVYLVPFHAHVSVSELTVTETSDGNGTTAYTVQKIDAMKNSDVAELTFKARCAAGQNAVIRVEVYHDGYLMPASVVEYQLTDTLTPYRYLLSNQAYMTNAVIKMTCTYGAGADTVPEITDMYATYQKDDVSVKFMEGDRSIRKAHAHCGGVTFDIAE